MRDASIILVLFLLWQSGVFLGAAIRYIRTEGSPMPLQRRFWLGLGVHLVPVLLLYVAIETGVNRRQLWLTGSYYFNAAGLPDHTDPYLPGALLILGGMYVLIEGTLLTIFRKIRNCFTPVLLSFVFWVVIMILIAVMFPESRRQLEVCFILIFTLLILPLPSVVIMCGFWSGNGRVIYTSMAIFVAWQIFIGVIGYIASAQLFQYHGGLA